MVLVRRAATAMLLLLAVAGVVLMPTGGAGAAKPTTTASTPKSWDPRLEPIANKVAELRKLDFVHPVAADFLDDAAFEKKVSIDKGKLTKQDKREIEQAQGQLRAVGLIGPDADIVDATSSLQTSGVLAYYDPHTKKITVKGTSTDDPATRVTVAHELTHALQDQHFDLQKLEKAAAKEHASTPLRTLVEGDAVRIQNDYAASLSQADQATYEQERASTGQQARAEVETKAVPESLSVLFEAPYALGPTMLDAVIAKEGKDGIDGLFEHPPTADAAYLTPSTLVEHRVFKTVAPPALSAGEKRVGEPDVFGAFALYQVLSSRLDPGVALTAADAWGGDSMVTFTRQGTTCLRSRFVGKTPAGTTKIGDALGQWAAQMPAGAAQVATRPGRVVLTACDPGAGSTEAPNRAGSSLAFVGNRDALFAEVLKQSLPVNVASCAADAVVRDPSFAPVIAAAGDDTGADPDAGVIDAVRARVPQILRECVASNGGS